ncbi:hypothetical protein DPV78_002095 [Talaromyces pinophilus]|nr:hypothetical protein DPV78_002095 [Talaromyces pinophilus]
MACYEDPIQALLRFKYSANLSSVNIWQAAPEDQTKRWQEAAAYKFPIPLPCGKKSRTPQSMTTADKMAAYARFYRSVCSHWLCVNITWAAGVSQHTDSKACEETFGNVKLLWCDDVERSPQEKIEAFELTDFVWGYLTRKLFEICPYSQNCPGWLDYDELIAEPILFNQQNMSVYTRIVRLATFYLSPPYIIKLLRDQWRPNQEE